MFQVYVPELIQKNSANSRTIRGIESPQEGSQVVIFMLENPALLKSAPASLENLSRNPQPPLWVLHDLTGQV